MAVRKDLTFIFDLVLLEHGFNFKKECECTDYHFEMSTT